MKKSGVSGDVEKQNEFEEKYRKKYTNSLRGCKKNRSMKHYLLASWGGVPDETTK